jgi:hypothetical protein
MQQQQQQQQQQSKMYTRGALQALAGKKYDARNPYWLIESVRYGEFSQLIWYGRAIAHVITHGLLLIGLIVECQVNTKSGQFEQARAGPGRVRKLFEKQFMYIHIWPYLDHFSIIYLPAFACQTAANSSSDRH